MGIENFFTFVVTALFFVATPGIDTIFVLNKSIGQGKRAGIYSSLGINAGVLVHTLFAALGLSMIIAQSATAFIIIKYLGAAYLMYLGIAKFFSKKGIAEESVEKGKEHISGGRNFLSGLVTNTLNPKVALFFLAFFPQFINPQFIDSPLPFLVLGITYAGIGIFWFLALALFAGAFSGRFVANPKASLWMNKISGLVFVLMGLKVALTKE